MKAFITNFFEKHWFKIILLLLALFLIASLIMFFVFGSCSAGNFRDNIYVEFIIGGLMLMIPIVVAATIGKKIAKGLFYSDIERVIRKIKEERENENITKLGARSIVKETVSTFGKGILEDPLFERLSKTSDPISFENMQCGVCGLEAELAINNRCVNCKLDCFAWEDLKKK
jgi:hypothetical protein